MNHCECSKKITESEIDECKKCYCEFRKIIPLECGHLVCFECTKKIIESKSECWKGICPVCREDLSGLYVDIYKEITNSQKIIKNMIVDEINKIKEGEKGCKGDPGLNGEKGCY